MGAELSSQEIQERLISDKKVNWDFLKQLRMENREKYHDAMFILRENGVITSEWGGNYFIFFHGKHIDPRVYDYMYYFVDRNHATEFQERFYPNGLVAKVEK